MHLFVKPFVRVFDNIYDTARDVKFYKDFSSLREFNQRHQWQHVSCRQLKENSFRICSIHKSFVPNLIGKKIHILTIRLYLFKATVYEEFFLLANYGILVCTHFFIYVKIESTLTFFFN